MADVKVVDVLAGLVESMEKDWAIQREKNERDRAISFSRINADIYKKNPQEIGTQTLFKQADQVVKKNATLPEAKRKDMPEVRLRLAIDHLFTDLYTPHGWPEVIDYMRHVAGGRYLPLVAPYMDSNEVDLPEIHHYERILQEVIRAKAAHERQNKRVSKLENDNTRLKSMVDKYELEAKERIHLIGVLEGMLSTSPANNSTVRKMLEELKQKMV